MMHHWILITFSWFGTVSLQYINNGGPGADILLDTIDSNLQYPLPYVNYFNLPPTRNDYETMQNSPHNEQTALDDSQADLLRKRRKAEENEEIRERRWLPNSVDADKNLYLQNDDMIGSPFVMGFAGTVDENATSLLEPMEKKYFSPWGGKRDKASIEHMWTWKRASNIREPSMPKRVRFSPWGGKRSGQMIYKPGFQFIPTLDKRHPIKILALSTKANERTLRDALPFKSFLESLPKIFKPGHPYLDVNFKKDGKRKVKFSAWGGKRSPPIIGPIWTPAPQNLKESTLDTILLIRNSQDRDDATLKAL
ncbi:uncharacterized protein LOC113499247 isoform X2 [Trichoplusia ni]|uniref:Uncharacterized protein LOC113499247 isoform X2 n=1 Tax=Trichoplusia ni TaxID=7111 RepID=A0A7E5W470_TRINI|nr:uncharacterized protein LOC113499247 isoform X2 [Trichoplusia ni]